jgi:hypothetical protein
VTQPTSKLSSLFKLEYPQSVGVYNTYDEAQKVVDFLADARFPVENLCIVGTELRSVERVLGRRSWRTVVGQGVQSGVSTGLMITLLMWLFVPNDNPLLLALWALGIGIVVGIGMAALGYWMSQGKRDFTSVSQTIATKYEVLAEHKVAGNARELVTGMPGARAAQFNPAAAPAAGSVPPAPGYGQQPYAQVQQPYPQTQPPYGQTQQPYPQTQPPYGQTQQSYGQAQQPYGYGQQPGPYGQPGYPPGQPYTGEPWVQSTGLGYPEQTEPPTEPTGEGPVEPKP